VASRNFERKLPATRNPIQEAGCARGGKQQNDRTKRKKPDYLDRPYYRFAGPDATSLRMAPSLNVCR
jgi:hypothetical protein